MIVATDPSRSPTTCPGTRLATAMSWTRVGSGTAALTLARSHSPVLRRISLHLPIPRVRVCYEQYSGLDSGPCRPVKSP